ncbi:MAG: hypothetical protein IPP31_11920 [Chitinophagaceae bacterium]|nr:hypothetical protein [Chitinophagaceae bacterium]
MKCKLCDTLKEKESWNKQWMDEEWSAIPEAFGKLTDLGFINGSFLYQCPNCGLLYQFCSWNESFGDGRTEFESIRKLGPEEAKKYLPEGM